MKKPPKAKTSKAKPAKLKMPGKMQELNLAVMPKSKKGKKV